MHIPRGLRTRRSYFQDLARTSLNRKGITHEGHAVTRDIPRSFVFFLDENPLPFVQRFQRTGTVVGLLLTSTAVVTAIFWRFPYWYTPFTIGSFLFFDRLSERFAGRSLLQFLVRQVVWVRLTHSARVVSDCAAPKLLAEREPV
jgi:hypothetical protein